MIYCPRCKCTSFIRPSPRILTCHECDAVVSFLNQSAFKSYQDCNRLYGWEHIARLAPERPRKALELGTAVHRAMVIAYQGNVSKEAVQDALCIAEQTFRDAMHTEGPSLPGDAEEVQSGVDVMRKLLPAYFRHYSEKGELWKPLSMEVSFCVEVGEETGVYLVGKIDNLATFQQSLWLVDYKTMGRLDMRDFMKYEIDMQLTSYIYGGTKQLSLEAKQRGEPPVQIRGAIIDGLVKTQIPQFHRELYTRSIDELREFEIEFVEVARELATKHLRVYGGEEWKHVFVKNTQQCFRYGTCPYRELCVVDSPTRRLSFRTREADYVDLKAEEEYALSHS